MEIMDRKIFTVLCCITVLFVQSFPALSQEKITLNEDGREMVPLTPDFRFREGIFLDFEQVRVLILLSDILSGRREMIDTGSASG